MTELADQRICINVPAHCTALERAFFGKAAHQPGPSAHLQPTFGSLRLLVFPKAKIALKMD